METNEEVDWFKKLTPMERSTLVALAQTPFGKEPVYDREDFVSRDLFELKLITKHPDKGTVHLTPQGRAVYEFLMARAKVMEDGARRFAESVEGDLKESFAKPKPKLTCLVGGAGTKGGSWLEPPTSIEQLISQLQEGVKLGELGGLVVIVKTTTSQSMVKCMLPASDGLHGALGLCEMAKILLARLLV